MKVFPGECVGVLGPNGSGKTTLFSMCIGEQNIDNGKIFINGKSIEEIPIHLRSKEGLGYCHNKEVFLICLSFTIYLVSHKFQLKVVKIK